MDQKISQLTPKGSNLSATDLLEISINTGGGTYATKNITGQQIMNSVISLSNTIFISNSGNDSTGNGSISNPYKTTAHAFSVITTASNTNPYVLHFLSDIVETSAPAIKPFIFIQGNGFAWDTTNSTFQITLSFSDWGTAGQVFEIYNTYLGRLNMSLNWGTVADVVQIVRLNNCEPGNSTLSEQGALTWQAKSLNQVLEYNNPIGTVSMLNTINTGTFTQRGGVCTGGTYQSALGNFSPSFYNVNLTSGVFLQTTTNTHTVTLNRTTPSNVSFNPISGKTITINGDASSIIPAQIVKTGSGTLTVNTISMSQSIAPSFTPVNFTSATPPTGYSRSIEQDLKGIDTALGSATVSGYPSNYFSGFQFTANLVGPPITLSIAAGSCSDSTNAYKIVFSGSTIAITNIDTGSWAPTNKYYVYVCDNPTTPSPICLFSLSPTAPNLSGFSGYTIFRRIGTVKATTGGTNIVFFQQSGNSNLRTYYLDTADITAVSVLSSGNAVFGAPGTINGNLVMSPAGSELEMQYFYLPAKSGNSFNFISTLVGASTIMRQVTGQSASQTQIDIVKMNTDASQAFRYYVSSSSDSLILYVVSWTEYL